MEKAVYKLGAMEGNERILLLTDHDEIREAAEKAEGVMGLYPLDGHHNKRWRWIYMDQLYNIPEVVANLHKVLDEVAETIKPKEIPTEETKIP